MLIPELNRLRPIGCEPFSRPRDYTGVDAITLGYVASGAVTFGPYSLGTEKAGEILALAATDIEDRNDGRKYGRLCVGRAAGVLVDVPASWGWTNVVPGTLGAYMGDSEPLEQNVISRIASQAGTGQWTGMRYGLYGNGPAIKLQIGSISLNQGGLGLKYSDLGVKGTGIELVQYAGTIYAEVTAETDETATFSIYTAPSNLLVPNPSSRRLDGVVIPKDGTLTATATGWGTQFKTYYLAYYRASIQRRAPSSFVKELQNQPFSVAVQSLEYLAPAAAFPDGLPWFGFIDSCARAGAWVARLSWPEGKAVKFTRHVGSTNTIAVCETGDPVTVDDFTVDDFQAADWLPVANEDLPWEVRYPLVDITDMPVLAMGTAHPFIVPRCEFPVVIIGEGTSRRLEILSGIPENAPWQVITDSLGQTVVHILGKPGAWRFGIEGTAGGVLWVPNWITEELEPVTLVFDENDVGRFTFDD